ncbi:ERF family protein [Amycolatopsis echigonensis]|uniref:ERF family protein n=1 Tax=Amycolatopsis echigonensis TaxID=2576905 RepID=A0A8E1W2D8_9PSEU|nr:ERF family protein [Amycolatopsis echigonensis]MBB2502928.1 ERF family protein [Amycolatopsis echigonensis]
MTDTPTIHQALNAVMRQVTKVSKSQKNNHFGFAFRGIEQIMEATAPAFREHGIIGPVPTVLDMKAEGSGKTRTVILTVQYEFVGPAGDVLSTVVLGEAPDTIKALSIAERIALIQVLHIPTSQRDADAPPPNTTTRARLQNRAAAIAKANGWQQDGKPDWDRVAAEYTEWSQGAEITTATDAELKSFLDSIEPKQTMKRGQ